MFKFIACLAVLLIPIFAEAQTFEKQVLIPQPKPNKSRYFYVPFDVPRGAKSLTVSYEYDKDNGANVLDLGVFDSRFSGSDTDKNGFRGWSGGRRSTIFIAENQATNGYVAGKIPAGTWRVILGLYKVAPNGIEVTVKVKFNEIDANAEKQMLDEKARTFDFPKIGRIAPLTANGYRWYRGDLHTHTFHSDGTWTVKGILDFADSANLDFIGITEHNTFSHHGELDKLAKNYPDLLVLRGEEVTTYGGHVNVWGLPPGKWIDFRVTPKDSSRLMNAMSEAADLKIPFSINHPSALCFGCDWSYGDEAWTALASVEIWNGSWDSQDETSLKKWDELLQQGKRVRAIGSSDSHNPPKELDGSIFAIGLPTNFVGAKKLTQKSFFEAIRNGRVWVGEHPTKYDLTFSGATNSGRGTIGDIISVSNNGEAKLEVSGTGFPVGATVTLISRGVPRQKLSLDKPNFAFTFTAKPNSNEYFRVEVRDENNKMLAFTNPIFIQVKQ